MFFPIKNSYKLAQDVVIIIGVLISICMGWFSYQYFDEKEQNRLEIASNEIVFILKNHMTAYEQILRSGVGFSNSSR